MTADSNDRKRIAENVLARRLDAWKANCTWVGDITYVAISDGWLYLAVVMDLASRRIVAWPVNTA